MSHAFYRYIDRLHLVSGLTVPIHLGLNNGPFVPHVKSWEPCDSTEVPDGHQACTLNTLRLQGKGAQIRVSE